MRSRLFMIRYLCSSLILTSIIAVSGCQTAKSKDFNKITLGQEKNDVLETIGNPSRIMRVGNEDRWYYIMYDEKQVKLEKVIHFFEGHVVFKGDPAPPFISAELQDEINEKKNIELSKKERKLPSAKQ